MLAVAIDAGLFPFLRPFRKQSIEQALTIMEGRRLKPREGVGKINQSALRCKIE
jgi:hypothetical protein